MSEDRDPKRADFMSERDKQAMGYLPRTHQNCIHHTGVARPGKTAYERFKRGNRHG